MANQKDMSDMKSKIAVRTDCIDKQGGIIPLHIHLKSDLNMLHPPHAFPVNAFIQFDITPLPPPHPRHHHTSPAEAPLLELSPNPRYPQKAPQ